MHPKFKDIKISKNWCLRTDIIQYVHACYYEWQPQGTRNIIYRQQRERKEINISITPNPQTSHDLFFKCMKTVNTNYQFKESINNWCRLKVQRSNQIIHYTLSKWFPNSRVKNLSTKWFLNNSGGQDPCFL